MYHDFAGREIEDREMYNMRQDARERAKNASEACEICQNKPSGPFIRVEVSDDGVHYRWLSACGDDCLHQVRLRWRQIARIIHPSNARQEYLDELKRRLNNARDSGEE